MPYSWFSSRYVCGACGYPIVVTQAPDADYWYYCSNKLCKNHGGVQLFDDDDLPDWTVSKKENPNQ